MFVVNCHPGNRRKGSRSNQFLKAPPNLRRDLTNPTRREAENAPEARSRFEGLASSPSQIPNCLQPTLANLSVKFIRVAYSRLAVKGLLSFYDAGTQYLIRALI